MEIALPTISRRSPLASWKMLVKAIFYFYQHDDEKCGKYLQEDAIDLHERIDSAIASQDTAGLSDACEELKELLFFVEDP